MKRCNRCGTQNKEDARFCVTCGNNSFAAIAASQTVPEKNPVPVDAGNQSKTQSPKPSQNPKKTRTRLLITIIIVIVAIGVLYAVGSAMQTFVDSNSTETTTEESAEAETTLEEMTEATTVESTTAESTTLDPTTTEQIENTTETSEETTQQATTTTTTVAPTTTQQVTTTSTTSAPTTTQQTTTAQPAAELKVLSVTSPITVGNEATLEFSGEPNTKYKIQVYYSSGASKAAGLEEKTSNSSGYVSWSWKVGTNTNPGTYRIVISGNNNKVETKFTVE